MFENQRVRDVAMLFAQVAGAIPVAVEQSLALGGESISAQLDQSVHLFARPIGGRWVAQMHALDEDGLKQVGMVPSVLPKDVPADQVVIWILFALGLFGSFQLDVEDGQIEPTSTAIRAKGNIEVRQWKEFKDRWMLSVSTIYFMSVGKLPCLPANRHTPYDAQGLATELWPMLTEDKLHLFEFNS